MMMIEEEAVQGGKLAIDRSNRGPACDADDGSFGAGKSHSIIIII